MSEDIDWVGKQVQVTAHGEVRFNGTVEAVEDVEHFGTPSITLVIRNADGIVHKQFIKQPGTLVEVIDAD